MYDKRQKTWFKVSSENCFSLYIHKIMDYIIVFCSVCFLFEVDLHNCVDGCRLPKNGNGKKLCIEKILKNG